MALAHSPLIIGHRGASAVAPENTLAAFARALDNGADGFELDVRIARDGVPVVIHDATLKRTGLRDGAVPFGPASRKHHHGRGCLRRDEILLHRLIARPKLVKAAISRDLPVAVWTVDDPVWIQRADKLGLSSLITNDPALLLARRG